MALEKFTKQPWEEFVIAGSIEKVVDEGELIDLPNCAVTAVDTSDDSDSTSEVINTPTIEKDDTNHYLKVQVIGGAHQEDHKITFKIATDANNQYEIDVLMKVRET